MNTQAILVIDPDENPPKAFAVLGPTLQELAALSDCDYVIIDPLLNMIFLNGEWEAIPIGNISQDGRIVRVA